MRTVQVCCAAPGPSSTTSTSPASPTSMETASTGPPISRVWRWATTCGRTCLTAILRGSARRPPSARWTGTPAAGPWRRWREMSNFMWIRSPQHTGLIQAICARCQQIGKYPGQRGGDHRHWTWRRSGIRSLFLGARPSKTWRRCANTDRRIPMRFCQWYLKNEKIARSLSIPDLRRCHVSMKPGSRSMPMAPKLGSKYIQGDERITDVVIVSEKTH